MIILKYMDENQWYQDLLDTLYDYNILVVDKVDTVDKSIKHYCDNCGIFRASPSKLLFSTNYQHNCKK